MIKKLSALILLTILLASLVTLGFYTGPLEASGTDGEANSVTLPMDTLLTVEDTIGGKHVKFYEHIIDDVIWVKNDYVLILVDPDTNETVRYDKSWRDIELPNVEIKSFQPPGGKYFWKKVAVFLNEEDCGNFYTFYDINKYPLVCWEVRYIDGTTVLYDLAGCEIGEGVPAPSEGFSLTGYDTEYGEVPKWRSMRENADYYFQAWCDSTISVFSPTVDDISSAVSNPDTLFYYALAHGGSYSFRANENEYYYDNNAYADMENRAAMPFAFLGHCEGMTHTDNPSFSDAFRKGGTEGTVTVGYTDMGGDDGWPYADEWQDYMFQKMNEGLTIKEAFDQACIEYYWIADAVVFLGDENLNIMDIDVEKSVKDNVGTWQDADSAPGPYIQYAQSPVYFKFTIQNTGVANLVDVDLNDTSMTTFYTNQYCTIIANFPVTLNAGETKSYYGKLDWMEGQQSSTATVDGITPGGSDVGDNDPAYYYGSQASIDVEKYVKDNSGEWTDADEMSGPYIPYTQDPVIFKFTIENTGSLPLDDVELTDTDVSTFYYDDNWMQEATFPTTLAVDETKTYYGKLAWEAGQQYDEATVVGTPVQVTEWKIAGTGESVDFYAGDCWLSPSSIKAKDGSYARSYVEGNIYYYGWSDWLRATNFGFTTDHIPAGSTINGIEVRFKRYEPFGDITDGAVYLRDSRGQIGDSKSDTFWPTSPSEQTLGGSDDMWGTDLEDSDILDNEEFGVDMRCLNTGSYDRTAYVDSVEIRVHYTTTVGSDVSDSDSAYYYGSQAWIDVEKYVQDNEGSWQDADSATGPYVSHKQDPVIFKFTIQNTGNVDLTGVNLTDTDMSTFYTDEACTAEASFPTTLAVDETKTYYGKLAWEKGQQYDESTAVGRPPVGSDVSDTDLAYYFGKG